MVVRLRVQLTNWLQARNWNRAASGACLTASRVANKVAVSTPLRIRSPVWAAVMSVVVMVASLLGCGLPGDGRAEVWSVPGMQAGGLFPPVASALWRAGVRRSPAGAGRGSAGRP